ncbi:MAG: hypothetical protein R2713_17755 [Ilumatobacteraceae bacterium]
MTKQLLTDNAVEADLGVAAAGDGDALAVLDVGRTRRGGERALEKRTLSFRPC